MDRKFISEYVEQFFHLYWKEKIDDAFYILNQVICLLYLRSKDDLDKEHDKGNLFEADNLSEKCSWKYMKSLNEDDFADYFNDNVVPFLEAQNIFGYLYSPIVELVKFKDLRSISLTHELFLLISELFDEIEKRLSMKKVPAIIYGIIYEELLSRYYHSRIKGETQIPRHVSRLMAELLQPSLLNAIYTPTLGSGELLISIYQKIVSDGLSGNQVEYDTDGFAFGDLKHVNFDQNELRMLIMDGSQTNNRTLFLSIMNFYFHGVLSGFKYSTQHPLSNNNVASIRPYSRIILAPLVPVSTNGIPHLDENLQKKVGKNGPAMYFLKSLEQLQEGGRLVALMPESFLFVQDRAITNFRSNLLSQYDLEAVISLPKEIFAPISNIKTSIIVLSKQQPTRNDVWMCELKNDGYSLNSKRQRNSETPLPELVVGFKERSEVHNALMDTFLVSKTAIYNHRSALTVKFYDDSDVSTISYNDPHEILSTLNKLEAIIQSELKDLSTLLDDGKILG